MYFNWQLWRMTIGLRGRIALGMTLGIVALFVGIARFVFLGGLLAKVFAGAQLAELAAPAIYTALAIVLRAVLEQTRVMLAHRTAAQVQEALRARLYDKIVALGPSWFTGSRTGGVMLTIVDGVEQLQSFFGQYLPQLFVSACAPIATARSVMPRAITLATSTHIVLRESVRALSARRCAKARLWPNAFRVGSP